MLVPEIHVPVNLLSPKTLMTLPDIESTQLGEGVDLIMSGAGDLNVDKAASMIAALQPPSGWVPPPLVRPDANTACVVWADDER